MSALFTPIMVGRWAFRNRVAMPPMVRNHGDADGCVTDAALEHYAVRARAGTGMIIVEATAVEEGGRCWQHGLCAYHDRFVPGLAELAKRIHAEGAVAAIQLVHGGPQSSPRVCGGQPVGPSAIPTEEGAPAPRALTVEEILAVEAAFADAADRAVRAGFDAVEVHGAHGFLLDSFLSTRRNARDDDYGGLLTGRMRALADTCQRARDRIGDRALLLCRISIFNHLAEGFGPDGLRQLTSGLEQSGIDVLDISTDGVFKGYFGLAKTIGQWAKEMTELPIIVAGKLGDPADAERAIAEGHGDFAAVGSAMLEDPAWTAHARAALG